MFVLHSRYLHCDSFALRILLWDNLFPSVNGLPPEPFVCTDVFIVGIDVRNCNVQGQFVGGNEINYDQNPFIRETNPRDQVLWEGKKYPLANGFSIQIFSHFSSFFCLLLFFPALLFPC